MCLDLHKMITFGWELLRCGVVQEPPRLLLRWVWWRWSWAEGRSCTATPPGYPCPTPWSGASTVLYIHTVHLRNLWSRGRVRPLTFLYIFLNYKLLYKRGSWFSQIKNHHRCILNFEFWHIFKYFLQFFPNFSFYICPKTSSTQTPFLRSDLYLAY